MTANRTQSGPLRAEIFVSRGQLQTEPVGVSQSAFAQQPFQQMSIGSHNDMSTASRSQTVLLRPEAVNMRDDAINDHHTDPVVVHQVPSNQLPEPIMNNNSDIATASRPRTDSVRPEMVGMGDNVQTDPIEAVQSDNEEMEAIVYMKIHSKL